MQKTVFTFGLISGLIIVVLGFATQALLMGDNGEMDMSKGEIFGYLTMIVALSMIFFGIRQFRDRHLSGLISFGQAFKVGFLIALIASAIYVIGWMVYYNTSETAHNFPAKYLEHMKEQWAASGISQDEINARSAGLAKTWNHIKIQ
ncbi:MAG: DUF4199 domain-containing protein [Saprospiraceae bacterium]|uniref:DUF4199 domain-containing protein n=1 Tax=Candidatus Opimibacter skivensis TaxID=2982028 RepID=A0A9D7SWW4_9BACT|nr:DUF4199 domain-containing protein [Candidatus Opimibacter skivensis]